MVRSLISSRFLTNPVTVRGLHRDPMLFKEPLEVGYDHPDGTSDPHVGNDVSSNKQSEVVLGEPCCPCCLWDGQGDSWSDWETLVRFTMLCKHLGSDSVSARYTRHELFRAVYSPQGI